MGTTSNYSWPYPESSDYVADGATAIENLADAIDTTVGGLVGTWTSYSPTWTASVTNPSVGSGILAGFYCQISDLVVGQVYIQTGSGYNRGDGNYYVSLPVSAASGAYRNNYIANLWAYDSSSAIARHAMGFRMPGGLMEFYLTDQANIAWTHNNPFTVGQNDQFRIEFSYEAA